MSADGPYGNWHNLPDPDEPADRARLAKRIANAPYAVLVFGSELSDAREAADAILPLLTPPVPASLVGADIDAERRLIDTTPKMGALAETIELELGMHNPVGENWECDCGDQIKGETFWHHVAGMVDYRLTATDGDA